MQLCNQTGYVSERIDGGYCHEIISKFTVNQTTSVYNANMDVIWDLSLCPHGNHTGGI